MRTIRRRMAVLFAAVLALVFSSVLYASDTEGSGRYDAVSCEKDGSGYQCDGEYLLLNRDGSGEILFNGTTYALKWKLDQNTLTFTDEDGEEASGTLEGNTANIRYLDYDYVFIRDDSSLTGTIDEGAEEAGAGEAPASSDNTQKEPENSDIAADVTDSAAPSGEGPAVYIVMNREDAGTPGNSSGDESVWKYDYIALNEDGSGVFLYNMAAYGIRWSREGDSFSFTDHRGNEFTGQMNGYRINGVYGKYRYTFGLTDSTLPSYTLSPGDWGKGLPYVVDEADVLPDAKEEQFLREAEELASEYDVGVYMIFVRSRDVYTWSGDISTLSEEIRAGYSLGIGSTEKKAKHETNPNGDWKDSILLTVAVNERKYDICASGDYVNWAFPTYGREKIRDASVDDLHENDWVDAAGDYLAAARKVLSVAAKGKQISFRNDTTGRLIGIFVPVILALLFGYGITAVLRSSMQNTQKAKNAASYIAGDKVNFTRREDRYIRTLVSRTYSPKEKSSGGGGGSFSSSSGSGHTSGSF